MQIAVLCAILDQIFLPSLFKLPTNNDVRMVILEPKLLIFLLLLVSTHVHARARLMLTSMQSEQNSSSLLVLHVEGAETNMGYLLWALD